MTGRDKRRLTRWIDASLCRYRSSAGGVPHYTPSYQPPAVYSRIGSEVNWRHIPCRTSSWQKSSKTTPIASRFLKVLMVPDRLLYAAATVMEFQPVQLRAPRVFDFTASFRSWTSLFNADGTWGPDHSVKPGDSKA